MDIALNHEWELQADDRFRKSSDASFTVVCVAISVFLFEACSQNAIYIERCSLHKLVDIGEFANDD